jgi:hypothetical protein
MRDELNELKTLILNDNLSAYYIRCFAHQLQLTLVVVTKNHIQFATFFFFFFILINIVFNVVRTTCKCHDTLS